MHMNRAERALRTTGLLVLLTAYSLLGGAVGAEPVAAVPREPYNWRNIAIGGGGYVTGIVVHPTEPNLVYIRTDVGGAYRFSPKPDALGRSWIPLTDHFSFSERNYYGIDSIAVDPSDPDVVYIAAGKYAWAGKGRIFRSDDRGVSWRPLPLELPMAAAGEYRVARERLAVDPNDSRRVYFGSRSEGLWLSENRGEKWRQVKTLPGKPDKEAGITFVLPDPYASAGRGKPVPVYAALYGVGIALSEDGGKKWTLIGGPRRPFQGAVARDHALYVTGPDGVQRFRRHEWKDVTPEPRMEFAAIAADPGDSSTLIVGESKGAQSLALYLTRDRGEDWTALAQASGTISARANVPWWSPKYFASATSALAFDPQVSNRLWLTDWYGTWLTDNARARPIVFRTLERGHEEVVPMTLSTPPSGAWLLSGVHDVNGFRHETIDAFPETTFSVVGFWNSFGIDYHEANPNYVLRVGTRGAAHSDAAQSGVALSRDNGVNWKAVPWPFGPAMKVAYSATDPNLFVVLPLNGTPKRTADGGKTWEEGVGILGKAIKSYWHWNHPLAADRVRGRTFYLLVDGVLYRSDDGGLNWKSQAKLPIASRHYLEAEPNRADSVWLSLEKNGLFHSIDGGATFERVETVKTAFLFALGRPLRRSEKPALFLYGEVENGKAIGIFRSDDLGASWTEIGDPELPIGDEPTIMRGDRQNAGRVYIGTNGRGIYVGIPAQ
jgi:photosystem II stability/assembly factor-like uncharacterized protein